MKPLRHAWSHVCARALAEAQHSSATATPATQDFLMEPVAINSKIFTLPSLPDHLDIKPNLHLVTDHTGIGADPKVLPIECSGCLGSMSHDAHSSIPATFAPTNLAVHETSASGKLLHAWLTLTGIWPCTQTACPVSRLHVRVPMFQAVYLA
jgi:hypothetical protein